MSGERDDDSGAAWCLQGECGRIGTARACSGFNNCHLDDQTQFASYGRTHKCVIKRSVAQPQHLDLPLCVLLTLNNLVA